jgi:hypothetical protein
LCHLITPYRVSNGVSLCLLYYLGGKYNYIIAAANAVVNPIANFLPILPEYFPFVALPMGLMPQFPTRPTQKCSLARERTCARKYGEISNIALKKPFLMKPLS